MVILGTTFILACFSLCAFSFACLGPFILLSLISLILCQGFQTHQSVFPIHKVETLCRKSPIVSLVVIKIFLSGNKIRNSTKMQINIACGVFLGEMCFFFLSFLESTTLASNFGHLNNFYFVAIGCIFVLELHEVQYLK